MYTQYTLYHFIPLYTELTFIFLPFHLHGLSVSIKSQSLQFFAFCTTQQLFSFDTPTLFLLSGDGVEKGGCIKKSISFSFLLLYTSSFHPPLSLDFKRQKCKMPITLPHPKKWAFLRVVVQKRKKKKWKLHVIHLNCTLLLHHFVYQSKFRKWPLYLSVELFKQTTPFLYCKCKIYCIILLF